MTNALKSSEVKKHITKIEYRKLMHSGIVECILHADNSMKYLGSFGALTREPDVNGTEKRNSFGKALSAMRVDYNSQKV